MSRHTDRQFRNRDVVYTPNTVAQLIVARYKPTGRVLDPCCGDGVFRNIINDCLWCEIEQGRDFFRFTEHVDWIVGNPPYSILTEWLRHSFEIANDVVYLLPIAKIFTSQHRMELVQQFGGMKEIWILGAGRQIGFDFGWSCGAVHFKRGWNLGTTLVMQPQPKTYKPSIFDLLENQNAT